jgi:hypothetical protein
MSHSARARPTASVSGTTVPTGSAGSSAAPITRNSAATSKRAEVRSTSMALRRNAVEGSAGS